MNARWKAALAGIAALIIGAAAQAETVLLPKGTVIPVALLQDLSSASIKVGTKIKAVYTGDEDGAFAEGTMFTAEVTEVTAKSEKSNGTIKAQFTTATLPGGKTIAIKGRAVATGTAKKEEEQKGKKKTGRNAAIGAGAGALVFKNDLAGALIGGTVAGAATASKSSKATEMTFKKGSLFGIELLESVKVPDTAAPKIPVKAG